MMAAVNSLADSLWGQDIINFITRYCNYLPLLMSCFLSAEQIFCEPKWSNHIQHNSRNLSEPNTGDYPSINNTAFVVAIIGGCISILILFYIFGKSCFLFPLRYACQRIHPLWIQTKTNCAKCCNQYFGINQSVEFLPVHAHRENVEPQHMINTPSHVSKLSSSINIMHISKDNVADYNV